MTTKQEGRIILPEEYNFDEGETTNRFADDHLSVLDSNVQLIPVTPSEWTEFAIRLPIEGTPLPFSFDGRRYLRTIYDLQARRILLVFSRQTEKCLKSDTCVLLANGERKQAKDVRVGDRVQSYDEETNQTGYSTVLAVSALFDRPCYRLRTRLNHEVIIGEDHPVRCVLGWKKAKDLKVGDRIAEIWKGGEFGTTDQLDEKIRIVASMLGDGCISQKSITGLSGPLLDDFENACLSLGWKTHRTVKAGTAVVDITFSGDDGLFKSWLGELSGAGAAEKYIPSWVFNLSRSQTALFINRLWATDGCCKYYGSKSEFTYCSISKRLVEELQSLLWKFGITSRIRVNWPSYWKRRGIYNYAYLLSIQTIDSVRKFVEEIGAIGKTENLSLPSNQSNNNRYVLPMDILDVLEQIRQSGKKKNYKGRSFYSAGLKSGKFRYPPTYSKLQQYVTFLRTNIDYDQTLVDFLESFLQKDVLWDEIKEIEHVGVQECVDIQTDPHSTFIANGIITHNSTLLGNTILSKMCITPYFRAIYVSPTHEQTKTFRRDRIGEPILLSPVIQAYISPKYANNVSLIKFVNYSSLTLRYAYLTADRCLTGDTRVQMGDGRFIPIQDITSPGSIVTVDDHGLTHIAACSAARFMGVKPVVKVLTTGPLPLRCTPDHKVWTQHGWVCAEDLKQGDFILAPKTDLMDEVPIDLDKDVAWLLGALVSEGATYDFKNMSFTNTDLAFLDQFQLSASRIGLRISEPKKDHRWGAHTCYSIHCYAGKRGPCLQDSPKHGLWELGEFGCKASQKRIPAVIFKCAKEAKYVFLHALFKGDGWYEPTRIGYCSSSYQLIEDLSLLLGSLGWRTKISYKQPSTENAVGSYTLYIPQPYAQMFLSCCGEFRVGRELSGAVKDIHDRIPVSYSWLRNYLKETHGLTTHTAWTDYGIQLRAGNRRDSVGKRVLTAIGERLQDKVLLDLASQSWVEVVAVIPDGIEGVYDLSVPGQERFIANGVVVHNCRGIPADAVYIDELQDILTDNIPVIEETASHANPLLKTFVYSGTPKSLDNTIEFYRAKLSTQNEWAVPCSCRTIVDMAARRPHSPTFWNAPLDEDNIGLTGLVCSNCGKAISAAAPEAHWVTMNPSIRNHPAIEPFESFRVAQIMVPWIDWREILNKRESYSRARFFNEVLALSFEAANRPLRLEDLARNSNEKLPMVSEEAAYDRLLGVPTFFGIDWGNENTRTVLSIGAYLEGAPQGKFTIFYWRRYEGQEEDPDVQLPDICRLIEKFKPMMVGCDYGGGHERNRRLINRYGINKIVRYQYLGVSTKRGKMVYDTKKGRYMLDRTECMSDIFSAIRDNKIGFPRWQDWYNPYATDMLNIFSEYNEITKTIQYNKTPGLTDDSFHSLLYCVFASMVRFPRPDIMRAMKMADVEDLFVDFDDEA